MSTEAQREPASGRREGVYTACIGSNSLALEAGAAELRASGSTVSIVTSELTGEAAQVGTALGRLLAHLTGDEAEVAFPLLHLGAAGVRDLRQRARAGRTALLWGGGND